MALANPLQLAKGIHKLSAAGPRYYHLLNRPSSSSAIYRLQHQTASCASRGNLTTTQPNMATAQDDQGPVRIERDTMGEVRVPADRLYGAQTQRSKNNFRIGIRDESDRSWGGEIMPKEMVKSMAIVKKACARVNAKLGNLDPKIADAITKAADEIIAV